MLRCPSCERAHFPNEVCGRDSERGLAYNGRLGRARSAVGAKPSPTVASSPDSPVTKKATPVVAKGKGKGRPLGPKPWRERKAEHWRAYMRDYMRARRARVI
jgi:hypothetical protein